MNSPSSLPRLPRLPGFTLHGELGVGASSVVYLGERGGRKFAIKLLRDGPELAHGDAMVRFRREAAAVARLNHPALVGVEEVGDVDGRPYLALEFVDGESLADQLSRGRLNEGQLREVARALAAGLAEVHRHGMVHRDLKPANVMMTAAGQVKLIDFGLVANAAGEDLAPDPRVAGTLLYAAPEQIGVLKRPVDGRSDLYALGVTLFHCATGRLPFEATSVNELIHQHAAVEPPNPRTLEPTLGPVLAAIIHKLLAKDPDDRYQTAQGLLADLDAIAELETQLRENRPLVLGSRDRQFRATDEVPVIGRDEELGALRSLFARTREGRGALVLVEGESGSGKTRLVRELIRQAQREGANVLGGKCQQAETIPLGPVRAAFDEWAGRMSWLEPEDRSKLSARLREACRDRAPVIARLSRAIGELIGDRGQETAVIESDQERFHAKVADFIESFARELGPAVLLVDDVQWLDDASLSLLKQLAARLESVPLLVVATSRNDAASEAAKAKFGATMGEQLERTLRLGPLPIVSVAALVEAHLGGRAVDAAFIERLARAANGNPLAIGAYVRLLLDSGELRPVVGRWSVDPRVLSELLLPKDIVQLLINRMSALSASTRQVLQLGAVIGNSFDPALIAGVAASTEENVSRALEEAVRANLIERGEERRYEFIHDRVREAVLREIAEPALLDLHQAVAEALDRDTLRSPERVYALARHYARGHLEKNPRRVFETSLDAGLHALENHAHAEAYELLQRAFEGGSKLGLEKNESAKVSEALGLACTRTARFDVAHAQFERALTLVEAKEDRARISYLIALAMVAEGKDSEAWKWLDDALALLGRPRPRTQLAVMVQTSFFWVLAILLGATRIGYGRATKKMREKRRLISQIYFTASVLAYMEQKIAVMLWITMRELVNTHFLGTSAEHARARSFYGNAIGLFGFNRAGAKHNIHAIQMGVELGDRATTAVCRFYQAVALDYAGKSVQGEAAARAMVDDRKYLSSFEKALAYADLCFKLQLRGLARAVVTESQELLPRIDETNNVPQQANVRGVTYAQLTILGRVAEAVRYRREQLELAAKLPNSIWAQAGVHFAGIHALVEQEEFGEELEKHIAGFLALRMIDYHTRYTYCLIAYARLEQLRRASGEQVAARRKALTKALRPIEFLGLLPIFRCHLLVVKGALASEDGKYGRADRLFAKAEKLARAAGSAWGQFAVLRERARSLVKRGEATQGKELAQVAYRLSADQGWALRMRQLKVEFRLDIELERGSSLGNSSGTKAVSSGSFNSERYMQALLQISLSSATFDLAEQSRVVLDELVRLLGAERAYLFLKDANDKLVWQAGRDGDGRALSELKGYASTVVKRVVETLKPVVVAGAEDAKVIGSESAVLHGIRSIIAAPVMLRERLLGVVYLDNRLAKGVFTENDTQILLAIANHLAVAVEMGRVARLEAERRALQKDLELTGAVQSLILPKESQLRERGVELAAFYQPATHCGGDWWWHELTDDGRALVLVGDVTGHGAASAMVTASVADRYQTLRESGIDDLSTMLGRLHGGMVRMTGGGFQMTMSALEIDIRHPKLRWLCAGAPPIFVQNAAGEIDVLNARGSPLGSDDFSAGEVERPLAKGERVFVFTDGAWEIDMPNGRQLGFAGLRRIIRETTKMPLEQARNEISSRLRALVGNSADDDITVVLFEISDGARTGSSSASPQPAAAA